MISLYFGSSTKNLSPRYLPAFFVAYFSPDEARECGKCKHVFTFDIGEIDDELDYHEFEKLAEACDLPPVAVVRYGGEDKVAITDLSRIYNWRRYRP